MISSEKKIAGVTSFAASCEQPSPLGFGQILRRVLELLVAASIITISASTVAPIAIAMPPSDMIVAGMSKRYIGMNASATASGKLRIGRQRAAQVQQEEDDDQRSR